MPAKTERQRRFFGWLLSHPAERKRRGISKKLAEEMARKPGRKKKKTKSRKRRKR